MKKFILHSPFLITLLFIIGVNSSSAQVGVGTTNPQAALDITATSDGILIPRVALSATNVATITTPTISELVYNTFTSASGPNQVVPGFYFWNGTSWRLIQAATTAGDWSSAGNSGTSATANFIGTTDAVDFVTRTNNTEKMRITAAGNVSINNLAPDATDFFTVNSNAASPWGVNGYSSGNGSGIFGRISSGSTNFGAVQGEYFGTSSAGTGVRGVTYSSTAGTTLVNANAAVNGQLGNGNNAFSFGVKGEVLANAGNQVGGVIGISNTPTIYGALGYRRSNGTTYAVLGNGAYQNNTSRSANSESSSVGLGINGGYLGGHIKGDQYGLITKGARFGSYTDGTSITNKGYAVINKVQNGEKVVTYTNSSTTIDVSTKGVGRLVNGTATITFDKNFSKLLSKLTPAIVTITPMGETNGVYVTNVTENGFTIKENKGGKTTIDCYWIAVGEKEITASDLVPSEVLDKDFEKNLDNILNIDEESTSNSNTMWWDGKNLKFGNLPKSLLNSTQNKSKRKPTAKNEI